MELKKNPKADLTKNSAYYFAIGLFAVLLFTYVSLEWKSYEGGNEYDISMNVDDELDEEVPKVILVLNSHCAPFIACELVLKYLIFDTAGAFNCNSPDVTTKSVVLPTHVGFKVKFPSVKSSVNWEYNKVICERKNKNVK